MLSPLPRRSDWACCFAHFTQPCQPSPIWQSGRPAHCPFRGLLGVHSRYGLHTRAVTVFRDTLSEGFSHFVTSIAAPVASGWSGCRVGFAPTGKRRLFTAHAKTGLMRCSKFGRGAYRFRCGASESRFFRHRRRWHIPQRRPYLPASAKWVSRRPLGKRRWTRRLLPRDAISGLATASCPVVDQLDTQPAIGARAGAMFPGEPPPMTMTVVFGAHVGSTVPTCSRTM